VCQTTEEARRVAHLLDESPAGTDIEEYGRTVEERYSL
jgi:hypothetical protein